MLQRQDDSLSAQFAERFRAAQRGLERALRGGARELPSVSGLMPNGVATIPIENVMADATAILADSGGVYLYHENVAVELGEVEKTGLRLLTTGYKLEPAATAILANYFTFEIRDENKPPAYFAPRHGFIEALLARAPTRNALPKMIAYARHPVYDENFVLCGPGYHVQQQLLVHGFDVAPILPGSVSDGSPILDRLPPYLRSLFRGFCFRADADVVNGLAAMITGVLANHFVRQPKPIIALDANQPGVGKTWFALAAGAVLDGELPELIHFTNEEAELSKRLLATLRQRPTSVLIVDNAKNRSGSEISSPCIEANSMAPNITLRILGESTNYTQPNNVLWFVTMNQTKISPDLASRGMPVRLFYEGDPAERVFDGPNPLNYALENRANILGELFGMVERWKSLGRRVGDRRHRCEHWAHVVGGILDACGFPEFLGNAAEAAAEFNTELGDLAALAERVVKNGAIEAYTVVANPICGSLIMKTEQTQNVAYGLPAGKWLDIFRGTRVEAERLDSSKSDRGRATIIGNFLGRLLGREVSIEVNGRGGNATLCSRTGGANKTLYYFAVVWEDESLAGENPRPEVAAAGAGLLPAEVATTPTPTTPPMAPIPTPTLANAIDRPSITGSKPTANDEAW